MSLESQADAIDLAGRYEALSQILGSTKFPYDGVAGLQDCLVNILVSALRSYAAFVGGIDQSHERQGIVYLAAIRNEVFQPARNLLYDLRAYENPILSSKVKNQSSLEEDKRALISLTNKLTITQYILTRHRSNIPVPVGDIPSILIKLEDSCKRLLYVDINPLNRSDPPPSTSLTFVLYEARLAAQTSSRNQASYFLICPRAELPQIAASALEVEFRCCCAQSTHASILTYRLSSEGSIPVEEIGHEENPTWTMFLTKGVSQVSLRLTQFEGLSLNHLALSNFVQHVRTTLVSILLQNPTVDHDKTSEMIQFNYDHLSVLRAKLSVTSLTRALYQVAFGQGRYDVVPWTPTYLQMFHYTNVSDASLLALRLSNANPTFYDEPYFWIYFSQKSPAMLSDADEEPECFSVRVSHDTEIMEPYPPTEVQLNKVLCISKGKFAGSAELSEIRFKFCTDSDAKEFYDSASAIKSQIFKRSMRCVLWKEDIVYRQDADSMEGGLGKATDAKFTIVDATASRNAGLRLIMTRDMSPRALCFDLGLSLLDGAKSDLTKILERQKIWTLDIASSGHTEIDQANWAQLVAISEARKARIKPSTDSGTAALKLTPSSAAEDWFVRNIEELNLVIRAMSKLGETKDSYKRTKIAVIDTGLMPNHHMVKQVKYRDFVAEAKEPKQNSNHRVVDECKYGIVHVPQDTSHSKHGTISVDIILRVYQDADLYVARVFEHDEAQETKEPFLMAEAINWAVEQQVDIISISAGFKSCPLPLRKAVHDAYTSHTLIFAAASNWGNNDLVAFPARIRDQVFCIFATDGLLGRTRYDPEPRASADNFAILGEDVQVAGGARLGQGTSAATAVAAGFAARILDFVSQKEISTGLHGVELLKMKVGMTAVFKSLVMPQGMYECIKPAKLLKERTYNPSARAEFREYVKKKLMEALQNVE